MSEWGKCKHTGASLCGLRAIDDFALQIGVGRHPRSQTRPSGLGSALLAQVSIAGGRRHEISNVNAGAEAEK